MPQQLVRPAVLEPADLLSPPAVQDKDRTRYSDKYTTVWPCAAQGCSNYLDPGALLTALIPTHAFLAAGVSAATYASNFLSRSLRSHLLLPLPCTKPLVQISFFALLL